MVAASRDGIMFAGVEPVMDHLLHEGRAVSLSDSFNLYAAVAGARGLPGGHSGVMHRPRVVVRLDYQIQKQPISVTAAGDSPDRRYHVSN